MLEDRTWNTDKSSVMRGLPEDEKPYAPRFKEVKRPAEAAHLRTSADPVMGFKLLR